jgi:hypothetical protein
LDLCALSVLHPLCGLKMLSGRFRCATHPGLEALGYSLKPLRGKSDMEPAASCSALEITQRPAHRTFTRRHADTPTSRYAFFAIAACAAARRATGKRNGLQLT